VLRDNNKIIELEEMLKKTKNNRLIMQPKEYHIALKDYNRLSKSTPKKFYKKSSGSTENSSRCRMSIM
jgi:hypothetical protein